jgi:hypothetical protein
VSASFLSCA